MSSSPETIPSKPQGNYVGTSNDGLTWDINETNLAPTNKSYLDPTGLLFPDSTDKWRIVMSETPSILGEREYSLVAAELKLVSPTTTYSGNSYDYTFLNLGSAGYGIKPDTGGTTDSSTGITTLKFDNKSLDIENDIKATFDQVTGLNTDQVRCSVSITLPSCVFLMLVVWSTGLSNLVLGKIQGELLRNLF